MLKFWKNGKKFEVNGIYGKGKVGQVVIYGQRVHWGDNPDPDKKPLCQYPYPSVFTIVDKKEGKDGYYVLTDTEGNRITLQDEHYGANESYLFDAQEWLKWSALHEQEVRSCNQQNIKKLDDQLTLLKDILIKQGFRVITVEQAKELDL